MKFSDEKPPIFEKIWHALPGVDWEQGVAIAYDGTIYSKYAVHPAVLAHEEVHLKQQADYGSANKWWDHYLLDPSFRLSQETAAYQKQVRFIKASVKDRNQRFSLIHRLALDFSSAMYGNLISYQTALDLLM